MNLFGVEFDIYNTPVLDSEFLPLAAFNREYLKEARRPLVVAVERSGGLVSVYDTYIHGGEERTEADQFYVERLVKFLLWAKGGYKVYICGDIDIARYIKSVYSKKGARAFDGAFMERVYEKPFEVIALPYVKKPQQKEGAKPLGRHLSGCRIGFDAGGSDRKISAVMNGEAVFSEEVVWFPKTNRDPDYHFSGIVEAFKTAAAHLPRVDAIGVSSAGIYINNRTMVASLFMNVPEQLFNEKVKDIYLRAAKEIGNIPIEVANDGDVTALAGSMELNDDSVLGIAMGTSEAAGYVDKEGNITGWLNELAFAPVDGNERAVVDEWSGDHGCGVKYFSQDAVIKLAPAAGILLAGSLSPAEKLKEVQRLAEQKHEGAVRVFETIGCYLGHGLAYYASFYDIKHVLLLGRVMSGEGGNIILRGAKEVLETDYPEYEGCFSLHLPDEKSRRVGQSVAAASLPVSKR